jgi:hypothetical protein
LADEHQVSLCATFFLNSMKKTVSLKARQFYSFCGPQL